VALFETIRTTVEDVEVAWSRRHGRRRFDALRDTLKELGDPRRGP
jgi:hypothetical protein